MKNILFYTLRKKRLLICMFFLLVFAFDICAQYGTSRRVARRTARRTAGRHSYNYGSGTGYGTGVAFITALPKDVF